MRTVESGKYLSKSGVEYQVTTKGPTALEVTSKNNNTCLQFWKDNQPVIIDKLVKLKGQTCSNRTFGDLKWSALFAPSKPGIIIIMPPGTPSQKENEPINITFVGS